MSNFLDFFPLLAFSALPPVVRKDFKSFRHCFLSNKYYARKEKLSWEILFWCWCYCCCWRQTTVKYFHVCNPRDTGTVLFLKFKGRRYCYINNDSFTVTISYFVNFINHWCLVTSLRKLIKIFFKGKLNLTAVGYTILHIDWIINFYFY